MKYWTLYLPFIVLPLSLWANAQYPTVVHLDSTYDKFTVKFNDAGWQLNGRSVNFDSFEPFLSFFEADFKDPCPADILPDLKAMTSVKGLKVELQFFVSENKIGKSNKCLTPPAESLYSIPLHRSWLKNDVKSKIDLTNEFTLVINDRPTAQFINESKNWLAPDSSVFVNWEFAQPFIETLNSFTITHFAHLAAAKNKPRFSLKVNSNNLDFYMIKKGLWMTASANGNWLIGSTNWSIWRDMDPELWVDRLTPSLKRLVDNKVALAQRLALIHSLSDQWSPTIRDTFHRLIRDESAPSGLKVEAVKTLKQKPTLTNIKLFIAALEKETDGNLLEHLSLALKVKNPKGPLIAADSDDEEISLARKKWLEWWKIAKDKID